LTTRKKFYAAETRLVILNDDTDVEPGCVEIIPRNLVTPHVRTWLSAQTDTRNFSDNFTFVTGELKKMTKRTQTKVGGWKPTYLTSSNIRTDIRKSFT
jgi:hypothetical protein